GAPLDGGGGFSPCSIPARPAESSAAPTRYGFDRAVGPRFSVCVDSGAPPFTRKSAERSSKPHEMLVGLNVCLRRRRWQFTVGAISASTARAWRSCPAMNDRHTSVIPCGSSGLPNTFCPLFASTNEMCVWQPLPADSANGLLMKVARYPSRCAISLTPFLNVKALSGPAIPMPGAKLISHCDPAYSQFE